MLLRRPFGPGRTEVRRGVIALLVVPALVTPTVSLPLLAALRSFGALSDVEAMAGLAMLGYAYAKLMLVMLVGGAPVWLVLRACRAESGGRFAIAGGLLGIAACFVFGGTGPSWQSPASLILISFCGVVGAATALLSWLIARSPD